MIEDFLEAPQKIYVENEIFSDISFSKLMNYFYGQLIDPQLDPLFSFVAMNMYILKRSFPEKEWGYVIEETFATWGRALRNILFNVLTIDELKKIENTLNTLPREYPDMFAGIDSLPKITLFPVGMTEEQRKENYKALGISFTSFKLENSKISSNTNYIYRFFEILHHSQEDDDRETRTIEQIYSDIKIGEIPLLRYVMLLFNDFLNSTISASLKFINYRLFNHHVMRDIIYSLHARVFLDLLFNVDENLERVLEFDITRIELNKDTREVFTGLSGNLRIVDEIVTNITGVFPNKSTPLIIKVLNIGHKGEEIFHNWREIRNDLGFHDVPSLVFVPIYPEQNLYGAYQKFKTLRDLYQEGQIMILSLPKLYEFFKYVLYVNPVSDEESIEYNLAKAYDAFKVFLQRGM